MMKNRSYFLLLALTSFAIGLFVLNSELPYKYSNLATLPLIASLLYAMIVFTLGSFSADVSTILIASLTFVRYSFLPLLMVLSNYASIMSHASHFQGNQAIFLLVYEAIWVIFAIFLANKRDISLNKNVTYYLEKPKKIFFVVIACLFYCIISIILVPSIQDIFKSVIELGDEEFTIAENNELVVGSIERAIRTLFTIIFNVTRIIFPLYIINIVIKKGWNTKLLYALVILMTIAQFMLLTSTFAEAIISVLLIMLGIAHINKRVAKVLFRWVPLFAIGIILLYFSVRYQVKSGIYSRNSPIEYVAEVTGAYFTGVDNVSGSLLMSNDESKQYLLSAIIQTIPFNTTLFGPRNRSLQVLYNETNGTQGQIPPTVGNGYFYFGFLLAPIISFIFVYYSILISRKANSVNNLWRYIALMFISIVLALGIAMYNEIIALSWINAWGIPLLLFAYWVTTPKTIYNLKN